MKFRKLILCISFVFIMFLSITNVNATDNVKIKSIDLVDKSINTTEVSNATFNGLEMNFDLKFMSVNDYAKYKVVVENKENVNYKISIDSNFGSSKYIAYDYVKVDSLKANSESEFYVTVSYKNRVSESDFSDGKYKEKNSAVLKLSDGSISNPTTSNNEVIIIIGLLVMTFVLFVLFSSKKNIKLNILVLLGLLSLPLFVKAIDSLKITVNSNVVIEDGYSVLYEVEGYIKASESDNYVLLDDSCVGSIYVGSVSEENKYLFCFNAIYKGNKKFAPGDNVNIKDTDLPITYEDDYSKCKYSDGSSLDDYDPTKDVVCESIIPFYYADGFSDDAYMYSFNAKNYFGYEVNDDDNTVMKFLNANDEWDSEKRIYININSSFTMPNHDVLFTYVPVTPN